MFRLLHLLLLLVAVQGVFAQQTDLTVQIKDLKTPFVVFGYFQGGKAYRLDSVQVDTSNGRFHFQKTGLQPGVYFCSSDKDKLFEFMLPYSSDTLFIGGTMARLDSLWSTNSPENEAFFRFEQQRKSLEGKFEAKKSMRNMIAQATKNDAEALSPIDAELDRLLASTDSLALDYVARNPAHLFAKMLRSVRPPDPPLLLRPLLRDGAPNPAYSQWQRQHYWDNTDFKNESLLNNLFWQVSFDNYFGRFVKPQPDSMIAAIDELLAKTPKNGAFYRFIVLRITQFFEQNEAPGADRIFVHMVDHYQKKQETPWLDKATLDRLGYKADTHRPNLTGSLAVNFTLPDETGKPIELYEIQAPFTLLIFYSPLCSHCMDIMPNIYQTYLDYESKGLAAIALNTDQQKAYWKKFVGQQNWRWFDLDDATKMEQLEQQYAAFNLPVFYLLDKDKKILVKKLKPNELGAILGRYFGKKD